MRPVLAASVAVFRSGRVLLARRTMAPGLGLFALPGGKVERGETMADAALRELFEEVGVRAGPPCFNAHNEVIGPAHHFVIASFVAPWLAGEGEPGPEASEVVWLARGEIGSVALVAVLEQILHKGFELAERNGWLGAAGSSRH